MLIYLVLLFGAAHTLPINRSVLPQAFAASPTIGPLPLEVMGRWNGFPQVYDVGKMYIGHVNDTKFKSDAIITWENFAGKPGTGQWLGWQSSVFAGKDLTISFWIKFATQVPARSWNFGIKVYGHVMNDFVDTCQADQWCYVEKSTTCSRSGDDNHVLLIFDSIPHKQIVHISQLKVENANTIKRSYKDDHVTMSQGNNIAKFSQLGTQFSVSFDFVPTHMHEDGAWSSVFHMTNTSTTCCGTGTRQASVWFRQVNGVNYLHVCTDIGGELRQYYEPEPSIQVGKRVSIRIAQNRFGDHYEFSIGVNCRLVWGEVNPLPQVVPNIMLYAGNRDHAVQEGIMSNLEVTSN